MDQATVAKLSDVRSGMLLLFEWAHQRDFDSLAGAALNSGADPFCRRYAVRWLWRANDDLAMPILLRAIADENASVRAEAAYGLGFRRSQARAALPVLLQALLDPNCFVRVRAVVALGAIGDPVAKPALLLAAQSKVCGEPLRRSAVVALARLGAMPLSDH